jgi:hypothetical protein
MDREEGLVSAFRVSALALIPMCATVAIAQSSLDSEDDANIAGEDEVDRLVPEMREERAREPVVDRTIGVYSTHYMVGRRRFDSLDELHDFIKDSPPQEYSLTRLAECSARARMEELLARQAELNRAYPERVRAEGRGYICDVGIGTPRECPW